MNTLFNSAITLVAISILLAACSSTPPEPEKPKVIATKDYVGDGAFTLGIEGPAIGRDGNLYVVNFGSDGTIGRVSMNSKGTGDAQLFIKLPEGSVGNGIRFDRAGAMYIADYVGHNILRVDMPSRQVSVYAHNPAMNQPNDIAITASGVLYASDPKWADSTGKLWRIDLDGSTHLLEENMGTTNGVEVSPDEKYLYVNESVQRRLWRYDILPDGSIANKRLLIKFDEFGMDGMRCDDQGNIYIARYGAGNVAVVSSEGKLLDEITLKGTRPTNLEFGGSDGKTLFVTLQDRGAIEFTRVPHPGRAFSLSWAK